ncbi:hypothetical protein OH76DRAFT_827654 [Lentinus brumalis]|uniref:Uncharacterized protein n=1 Tax=Lentinus brumalis TaxID=2498619 RepID=A0A371D2C2_9APHY|nr:hypothetical protein OH76DRAFT_827654 [Polyporus brumalis]
MRDQRMEQVRSTLSLQSLRHFIHRWTIDTRSRRYRRTTSRGNPAGTHTTASERAPRAANTISVTSVCQFSSICWRTFSLSVLVMVYAIQQSCVSRLRRSCTSTHAALTWATATIRRGTSSSAPTSPVKHAWTGRPGRTGRPTRATSRRSSRAAPAEHFQVGISSTAAR